MLFESVITNVVYYGFAFVWYLTGVAPVLPGIALLLSFGSVFDSIVSIRAYAFLLRKQRISILNVQDFFGRSFQKCDMICVK